ncbi:MAG: hypothetical protein PWQ55_2467 [Chloroflexota bacterium]|nr:hypothetical protein [Chloroflexota bacterium]
MWDFLDEQEDADKTADKQQDKPCRISVGQDCPRCGQAKLDYNSLLNLSCPHCGYEVSASFT